MKKTLKFLLYISIILSFSGCQKQRKAKEWNKNVVKTDKHINYAYRLYAIVLRQSKVATSKTSFEISGNIDAAIIRMKKSIKEMGTISISSDELKKLPTLSINLVIATMGILKELQVFLDKGTKPDFEDSKIKEAVKKLNKSIMELKNFKRDYMIKYDLQE
jgi:hypothetical protein